MTIISKVMLCNIYNLVIPDSIDDWIEDLIVAKMMAAKFSQGDIDAEEFSKKMRYEFKDSLRKALGIDG